MFRLALAGVLALACGACSTMRSVENYVVPAPPDPATQMPALEARIFELVQRERHRIDPNARPLTPDSELVTVARQRSQDMASKNYLEHKSPEGTSAATIIMDEDAKFQGLLGEDIAAQTYTKRKGVDVESFAHRFVDAWLASPKHKDNLSYAAYERSGVGAAVNGDTVYVTQLFATDLGLPPPADAEGQSVKELAAPAPADGTTPDPGLRGPILPAGNGPAPPAN